MRFDFFSFCCVCVCVFLLSLVAIFRLVDEKRDENKIPNYCIIYLHFQPNQWVSNRIFSWLYGRKTFFTELIAIVSLWKFQHFKSFEHHSSLAHLSQLGIFFMPTKLLSLMCMYVHTYNVLNWYCFSMRAHFDRTGWARQGHPSELIFVTDILECRFMTCL